ncbi:hypothetical protein D9M68_899810 [compost metagenome]
MRANQPQWRSTLTTAGPSADSMRNVVQPNGTIIVPRTVIAAQKELNPADAAHVPVAPRRQGPRDAHGHMTDGDRA